MSMRNFWLAFHLGAVDSPALEAILTVTKESDGSESFTAVPFIYCVQVQEANKMK